MTVMVMVGSHGKSGKEQLLLVRILPEKMIFPQIVPNNLIPIEMVMMIPLT